MRTTRKAITTLSLLVIVAVTMGVRMRGSAADAPRNDELDAANNRMLKAFAEMDPIDTHVHVFKSDPDFTAMLVRLRLHVLDINVADTQGIYGQLATELERSRNFVQGSQRHASLCVTFSPFEFQQKDFGEKTIAELRQEFAAGAVAVKIWKNIGMELKRPDGTYVMPDDPVFEPISGF